MTKTEAYARLAKLREDKCTCGDPSLLVAGHKRCGYRMAAWLPDDLRPFVGGLYSVADAEPAGMIEGK